MTRNPWPSEWLRGMLSLAVLRVLSHGPTYGYAIAVALEDAGFGAIKGGTLYPLLSRLEASDVIESQWRDGDGGPSRKYFQLTDAGRSLLRDQASQWREFADHTTRFLCSEDS